MKKLTKKAILFEAKRDYFIELAGVMTEVHKALKDAYLRFKTNPQDAIVVNNQKISVAQFAILLGNELFNSPRLGAWTLLSPDEEKRKREFINYEFYLRQFPGVAIPPRPKLVERWLGDTK